MFYVQHYYIITVVSTFHLPISASLFPFPAVESSLHLLIYQLYYADAWHYAVSSDRAQKASGSLKYGKSCK